jgi:hypothetical protein
MALADLARTLFGLFPSLAHPLAITTSLLPAALLAPLARPIPPRRLPRQPIPRCVAARLATVPRPRMVRGKPLLTPLQKTDPRTAMPRGLPSRRTAIMLKKDHGRICSRRSSPGVESPTPLRDAFESLPPAHPLLVQLNHTDPTSPRFPLASPTGSHPPQSGCARPGPLAPRNWPPLSRRRQSGRNSHISTLHVANIVLLAQLQFDSPYTLSSRR